MAHASSPSPFSSGFSVFSTAGAVFLSSTSGTAAIVAVIIYEIYR